MTFAEKLRELRDAAGLSEAKLAAAAGIPFGTVHTYAMGRRRPGFSAVLKIAKALGVTCEAFADCSDLVDGEPEPAASVPRKKTTAGKPSRGRSK
jgi:transcriptional regulator with XRE-family HTH domain